MAHKAGNHGEWEELVGTLTSRGASFDAACIAASVLCLSNAICKQVDDLDDGLLTHMSYLFGSDDQET
jgi:hypothetical protein